MSCGLLHSVVSLGQHVRRFCAFLLLLATVCLAATKATAEPQDITSRPIPVLMYHQLAPRAVSLRARSNVLVTPEVFEMQLIYLRDNGYTTITCEDLRDHLLLRRGLPPKPVLITFDDGWRSNYLYAFPLLAKHNMRAVIFLITAMMGHTERLSDPVQEAAGLGSYLSWDQVREMAGSGLVSFESHSHNLHFRNRDNKYGMDAVSSEHLVADIMESIRLIYETTGKRPVAFAYPYGHFRASYFEHLSKAGIQLAFTVETGVVDAGHNPYRLPRITVYPYHRDLGAVLEPPRKRLLPRRPFPY